MTAETAPKKSNRNRNLAIGCGGLIVLLLLCTVASQMGGKSTPATGTVVTTAVSGEAKVAEAPTANPNAPHAVGETIAVGNGATLTVESAKKNADGELVLLLVFDNTAGTEDATVSSIASFEVKDADGNKGKQTILFGDAAPSTGGMDGTVLKGDKLRGYIAYQAGLGTGLKLYYAPNMFSTDRVVFDLGQ